jgi:hypothetical protein
VLYDILKDTYKFNPDNGGFEEFVKSKEKANRNYKSTPSYTEFKDRLDEYNRYKSSTGMIGANIKKELDTGTNR